jgi:membrane-associated phospholipid phosphatase
VGERTRATAAGMALAASLLSLRSARMQAADRRAGAALSRPLGDAGDRVVSAGTDLGSVFAIGGIAAALVARGRPRRAVEVVGSGAIAWTVAQGIKPLVRRPRPYQSDGVARLVVEPAGASWPSGHVAVAAAMAEALAPSLTFAGRVGAAAATTFVGYSRIYVGVHYLSDVLAGAGLGVISARLWRGVRRLVTGHRP